MLSFFSPSNLVNQKEVLSFEIQSDFWDKDQNFLSVSNLFFILITSTDDLETLLNKIPLN